MRSVVFSENEFKISVGIGETGLIECQAVKLRLDARSEGVCFNEDVFGYRSDRTRRLLLNS